MMCIWSGKSYICTADNWHTSESDLCILCVCVCGFFISTHPTVVSHIWPIISCHACAHNQHHIQEQLMISGIENFEKRRICMPAMKNFPRIFCSSQACSNWRRISVALNSMQMSRKPLFWQLFVLNLTWQKKKKKGLGLKRASVGRLLLGYKLKLTNASASPSNILASTVNSLTR